MKGRIRFLGLAMILGLVVGTGMPMFGQTGDCYSQYPGCLDIGFGVNGKVTLPTGMNVGGMAVQMVGSEACLVVGGGLPASKRAPGPWVLVRYRADGSLDSRFGTGGIVKYAPGNKSAGISGIAVQPDQKIVVAGAAAPLSRPTNPSALPTVARYNANGTLDTTFGTAGLTQVRCPIDNRYTGDSYAVVVQSDLKIAALTFFYGHLGVFRLNPNGTLDASFNGSGCYYETRPSCAFAIATQWVDSEERIVVSGNIDGRTGVPGAYSKGVLMRFTGAGAHDQSFGDGGYVIGDFRPYNDGFGRMGIDSFNRIAVGWQAEDNVTYAETNGIIRYNVDGSLDPSFGAGGIIIPTSTGGAGVVRIEPGADEKILGAGIWEGLLAAWRFVDSGLADSTFGVNGWITTESGGAMAQDVVLLPDGKFAVLAGSYVMRFWR